VLAAYLASKPGGSVNAFDGTAVKVLDGWSRDEGYRALHQLLDALKPTQAIAMELSAENNKGLKAIWVIESAQKRLWWISLQDGSLVATVNPNRQLFDSLFEQGRKACPKTDVNIATVFHGTMCAIVHLSRNGETVSLYYEIPNDVKESFEALYTAMWTEDQKIRRQVAAQNDE
jgi:hypothetical protein